MCGSQRFKSEKSLVALKLRTMGECASVGCVGAVVRALLSIGLSFEEGEERDM